MTTAVTTHPALADTRVGTRRSPRSAPRGLPRWLWLLGVGVQPLGRADDGTRAWVVTAGGGVAGMAALFFETTENTEDPTREDQP